MSLTAPKTARCTAPAVDPKAYTMSDAVAFMTGARVPEEMAA